MTDFGTEHWYVAAMKGEILARAPDAMILDLSHHVSRHAVDQAAFILHCAIDSFPRRTIFCCVVDPGVGSGRRSLVGWAAGWGFVGPDNGLVTPLIERDKNFRLHEIKSQIFRNERVCATFHGRDVFAPAAARLLLGDDPRMAGPRVDDPVRLPPIQAENVAGVVQGRVMMIDHFGNAVTNVQQFGDEENAAGQFEMTLRSLKLTEIDSIYQEKPKGKPLCYWGSSGFLEIAVNYGSAAETYGIQIGDPIAVRFSPR
jgi:hypothetical protein